MPLSSTTADRKQDHLRIVLENNGESARPTGLERVRLVHRALPELDLAAIDTRGSFLGLATRAPVLISGMTGGIGDAVEINRRLALAAAEHGCAMGVGSQRVAIEDGARAGLFSLRAVAPNVPLFANLGAVQLNHGFGLAECQRAVEMIEADALVLHLNPLQEALQPGGNTNWSGLLRRIAGVCRGLPVPVIAKEVGWGLSGPVARQLRDAGVAALDTGGAGGTSWSAIERERALTEQQRRACDAFADWGISTAESLRQVRAATPGLPAIASGGLRTGVDVAKAIALGATLAGVAAPLLRAAVVSETGAAELLAALIHELRIAMFCCGAGVLADLQTPGIIAGAEGGSW